MRTQALLIFRLEQETLNKFIHKARLILFLRYLILNIHLM
jgi:hypothetical protein